MTPEQGQSATDVPDVPPIAAEGKKPSKKRLIIQAILGLVVMVGFSLSSFPTSVTTRWPSLPLRICPFWQSLR